METHQLIFLYNSLIASSDAPIMCLYSEQLTRLTARCFHTNPAILINGEKISPWVFQIEVSDWLDLSRWLPLRVLIG